MRLLAISDNYIPSGFMQQGFASLADLGVEVEVRRWEHPTLVDLQEANLAIEQGGPDAVTLPSEITDDVAGFDIVSVQFTPLAHSFIQAGVLKHAELNVVTKSSGCQNDGPVGVNVPYNTAIVVRKFVAGSDLYAVHGTLAVSLQTHQQATSSYFNPCLF